MKAVILLSIGLDPVSGRPAPVPGEVRAIGLARALGVTQMIGLHAGPASPALADYGGYGLTRIICLKGGEADPVQALATAVKTHSLFADGEPDLVLAASRGRGGSDTGLLPYQLAQALGWPIATDVGALIEQTAAGQFALAQFRARGAVRPVSITLPCVVTVPETARSVPAFVFARQRTMRVDEVAVTVHSVATEETAGALRPYRRRPKLISGASKGNGGGQLMVNPDPHEAARAIVAHLRVLGVLPDPDQASLPDHSKD
ncbi:electron transfer flavoprotein subunit beta [Acetobacter sp.]|jgi:electron transfer flavoprotein beta subunit|uniref:electron transfer flavoprotein subunit beta n=1 Tax=Acetobacter sp. TaxID=440 RepID=UPI0025C1041D|nr:electron transfer flavoprotein subunit beta [Acetobacter sp.]MCH4090991.1 electron transfer flavoprotein subunit beta [Acetobacter sp.]MCI1300174.1 electron transfer flavoprotein subunit beta [Acetobacter sp.]MCI1316158.1 electron transfer flavoprotein subunit beta [Acetobacter sp.]